MADDKIRLGLDLGDSAQKAKQLASSLGEVKQSAQGVADTYEVLAGVGARYSIALFEQDRVVATASKSVSAGGRAASEASAGFQGLGHSVLSTSFAIQDFTSVIGTQGLAGGLRAVQNNIPIIISQMAGGAMGVANAATLAGAVSIVTVGLGLLYENWGSLTEAWGASESKIPKIKADLEGLGETINSVAKEIADLEERSLTDVLDHATQVRLGGLKAFQANAGAAESDRKLVEGVGRELPARLKELIGDVKKAVGAAGGGEAIADGLRFTTGGTYQDAVGVVADAMRGDRGAIDKLRESAPRFGREFDAIDAAKDQKADDGLRAQQNEWDAKLGAFQDKQRAEEEAAKEKAARAGEAGVREQQQNMTDAQKAVQATRDAQDKRALQGVAARRFGFDLSDEQADDALKEARDLMGKKVPQVEAGRSAIAGIVQEVLQTAQQMSGGQMMQEAEIQSLRMQLQALQQNQRFTRTRMNHTR